MVRMGTPFAYLQHQVESDPQPVITPGGSGYFSAPSPTLDPHLFDGQHIKPEVRAHIIEILYAYWARKYRAAHMWSTVWLAGSGISYQWSADRGNGDLDVLIGVDYIEFVSHNPQFQGMGEETIDSMLTDDLKANLWPQTATTNINGQTYEVTYFVNNGASDIRTINPYAAYDLSHDRWTVKPPVLPQDPESLYPSEFWRAANDEKARAERLVANYNGIKNDPTLNGQHMMQFVVDQAKQLFDDIHQGRHQAFGPGGTGYGDYYNFRWQFHKRAGTVQALHALATMDVEARKAKETAQYGAPLDDAATALAKAALWNRR